MEKHIFLQGYNITGYFIWKRIPVLARVHKEYTHTRTRRRGRRIIQQRKDKYKTLQVN